MSERIPVGTDVEVIAEGKFKSMRGTVNGVDLSDSTYSVLLDGRTCQIWFDEDEIRPLQATPPIYAVEGHIGDKSTKYRISTGYQSIQIGLHGNGIHQHVFLEDLPRAVNFIRALMDAVEYIQPGVFRPLPDGDPSIVDAMKVLHEADRIQRETR